MADTLRIRRRLAGGAAGAPSTLRNAELAFNEQDDTLYYGKGDSSGNATSILAIGGPGAFQPKDADLTALAALSGTGIYYRSAADTWSLVTIGTGLSFSGGVLSATGGGSGNVNNVGTPVDNQLGVWTGATTIEGDAKLTWDGATFRMGDATNNGGRFRTLASGNGQFLIDAFGVDTNIVLGFSSKGTSNINFYTGAFARAQVQIIDAATVDKQLQLSGGSGKASIGATGGAPVEITNPDLRGTVVAPTASAASNDQSVATTAFVKTALSGAGVAAYAVRGLGGGTATSTTFQLTFHECILHNSSGVGVLAKNGNFTVNISAAVGANGPDATLADGDLHFYAIWNGTTLAGICSNTAPPTGPALPSGYTHWGYLTTAKRASGVLSTVYVRGNKVFYAVAVAALSNGNSASWASLSVAASVPALATAIMYNANGRCSTGGGGGSISYAIGVSSGNALNSTTVDCSFGGMVNNGTLSGELPNVSQTIWYANPAASGGANFTFNGMYINVVGYAVPNDS